MLSEENIKKIKELCQKYPAIKLLYVFGSQTRGDAGPLSDYDFAVYLDEKDVPKRFSIKLELMGELSLILHSDKIDVAVINDVDNINLKYAIVSDGELLYGEAPCKMIVEARILNEYFDFRIFIDQYQKTK
jgi:hypothetical protein